MSEAPPRSRRPWIAIVGPFPFPEGRASSRRVAGLARSLSATGARVVVLAADSHHSLISPVDGIPATYYMGTGELRQPSRLRKLLRLTVTGGREARKWIETQPTAPRALIIYGGSLPYILTFQRWTKRTKIPLIHDVVEWYDPRHVQGGRFGPLSLASMLEHRILHRFASGVIVISSYLEAHYRAQGIPCVRIPPSFHLPPIDRQPETASPKLASVTPLRVTYFGFPGQKDDLSSIVNAAAKVKGIELVIAGPDPDEVLRIAPKELHSRLRAVGHVSQRRAAQLAEESHFTVFLRKTTRSNRAGFPTKFVESLSLGTPVITNLTSDLHNYLKDGENGLVVETPSSESLSDAMRRATEFGPEHLAAMRQNARTTSRAFDTSNFNSALSSFLTRLEMSRD